MVYANPSGIGSVALSFEHSNITGNYASAMDVVSARGSSPITVCLATQYGASWLTTCILKGEFDCLSHAFGGAVHGES